MKRKYFVDLTYSLANEDTTVEFNLLDNKSESVFVIPSSGAQALPLLAKNPIQMDIVDLSFGQIALTELRLSSLKQFDYDQWLYFMGHANDLIDFTFTKDDRYKMFQSLKLNTETKNYWLQNENSWTKDGFIWLGKWEKFHRNISTFSRKFLNYSFDQFFEPSTLAEQINIYEKNWPKKKFKFLLNIVTNKNFINPLLYKGFFSGSKENRTTPVSTANHIESRYRNLFYSHLANENFFLQMLFLGKIKYLKALPLEAHENIFNLAKKSSTHINYYHGSYSEFLFKKPYNFIHMSDVLSYLDDTEASSILEKLHPQTTKNSKIVARTFMKAPSKWISENWIREASLEKVASSTDKTGVYDFLISRKI